MRKRHVIEVLEDISDEFAVEESWRSKRRIYANVFDVAGGERFRGRQLEAEVTCVVETNYHEWLDPKQRFEFRGKQLEIVSILDREQRQRELEIHCSRVESV